MNRFEFKAVGRLLYGESWKTEMAHFLDLSAKSNIIDKMAKGERAITENTKSKLLSALRLKAALIYESANLLAVPNKIRVRYNTGTAVVFDQYGIRVESDISSITSDGLVFLNYTIPNFGEKHTILQSYAVSAAYEDCIKQKKMDELKNLILEWFEFEDSSPIVGLDDLE